MPSDSSDSIVTYYIEKIENKNLATYLFIGTVLKKGQVLLGVIYLSTNSLVLYYSASVLPIFPSRLADFLSRDQNITDLYCTPETRI
jgi:hypothetical protein